MMFIKGLLELYNETQRKGENDSESENEHKKNIAIKTTILLGELLYFSNTHLPPRQCARLQVSLMSSAAGAAS